MKLCIVGKYMFTRRANARNKIQRKLPVFQSASSRASYCIKVCLSLMKHMYKPSSRIDDIQVPEVRHCYDRECTTQYL